MNWFYRLSRTMWDKKSAEDYLLSIIPILDKAGFNAKIVGSVSKNGWSEKDLDILLTPKIKNDFNFEIIVESIPGDFSMNQETYYAILPDGKVVDFFVEE